MKRFRLVSVVLKRYYIGNSEVRVHHRADNDDVVQAWRYVNGELVDTILSIDHDKKNKVIEWFFDCGQEPRT